MEQRQKLRAKVEAQKKTIMEKFEQVKKQGSGNLSAQDLSALLNVSASPVPATASPVKLQAAITTPPKPNTQPAKPNNKSSSISPVRQRPSPAKPSTDSKSAEQIGREKLAELRKKQNEELLKVLDEEQRREEEREQQLAAASEQDRAKLEKGFGLDRAKASKRVVGLSE